MIKALGVVLTIVLWCSIYLSSETASVAACECPPPETPARALVHAQRVFKGTVINITQDNMGSQLALFQVDQVWKGDLEPRVTVFGPPYCGNFYHIGETYLVYTDETGQVLVPAMCGRTRQIAYAGEDLAALGKGISMPTPATDILPETGHGLGGAAELPASLITLVGLVLISSGVYALNKVIIRGSTSAEQ